MSKISVKIKVIKIYKSNSFCKNQNFLRVKEKIKIYKKNDCKNSTKIKLKNLLFPVNIKNN